MFVRETPLTRYNLDNQRRLLEVSGGLVEENKVLDRLYVLDQSPDWGFRLDPMIKEQRNLFEPKQESLDGDFIKMLNQALDYKSASGNIWGMAPNVFSDTTEQIPGIQDSIRKYRLMLGETQFQRYPQYLEFLKSYVHLCSYYGGVYESKQDESPIFERTAFFERE